MPYYFMRDTPLQALEQLMMSQPGQKPRGGGIYRSPFRYTPEDVACEYCQNYVRKHPCRLCECTCLEERIEAGVLELNAFMRDCFTPSIQIHNVLTCQIDNLPCDWIISAIGIDLLNHSIKTSYIWTLATNARRNQFF